ncbi:MAG: RNA polymerase sigma factor [Candidatus Entotheonellia bacterium]
MKQTEFAAATLAYLDALYNLASWLAHEPEAASTLVHETYRKALQTVPKYLAGTKLRVRLFTLLWEIYRQHHPWHSETPASPREREEMGGGEAVEREKAALSRHLWLYALPRGDVEAELRGLSPDLRAVLLLVDVEGYPLAEVAEILGWPRDQVYGTLSKARRTLYDLLQVRLPAALLSPPPEAEDQS